MSDGSAGLSRRESVKVRSKAQNGCWLMASTAKTESKRSLEKPLEIVSRWEEPPPCWVSPSRKSIVVPSAFDFRMKLMTPEIASDPYTAESLPLSISTRSISEVGMLEISVKLLDPLYDCG